MLTKAQLSLFWRTFQKACIAKQLNTSVDRDYYRKDVMREECSCSHMSDISRTVGFEKIMLRLNLDAGDFEAAARFESGRERRMAHLVEVCAAQLMQLQGLADDDALVYVIGVIQQAQFSCRLDGITWWLDLVEGQLESLFDMLDTHRRRLLKRDGWTEHLKFNAKLQYSRMTDGHYRLVIQPIEDSSLRIRVA